MVERDDAMRIVFFGATELGYKCCRLIIEKELAEIVGIFTMPRQFNISYAATPVTNLLHKDFHKFEEKYKIPVIEVTGKMHRYKKPLQALHPDFLLVVGWYYMISKSLRQIAPLGCAGIHASLLPKYRGGAPLVWALINGEEKAGVSLFYFEDGVDDGDIIAQEKFQIDEEDTIKDVMLKATDASLSLIKKNIPLITDGSAPRIPQNHTDATYVPQRKPEDGLIDWSWDSKRIHNFIRAQTKPYPGAYTIINDKKILIWDANIIET
jgi:methionyl-tRNA formyltransferase